VLKEQSLAEMVNSLRSVLSPVAENGKLRQKSYFYYASVAALMNKYCRFLPVGPQG